MVGLTGNLVVVNRSGRSLGSSELPTFWQTPPVSSRARCGTLPSRRPRCRQRPPNQTGKRALNSSRLRLDETPGVARESAVRRWRHRVVLCHALRKGPFHASVDDSAGDYRCQQRNPRCDCVHRRRGVRCPIAYGDVGGRTHAGFRRGPGRG